jgi:hypothetical protein
MAFWTFLLNKIHHTTRFQKLTSLSASCQNWQVCQVDAYTFIKWIITFLTSLSFPCLNRCRMDHYIYFEMVITYFGMDHYLFWQVCQLHAISGTEWIITYFRVDHYMRVWTITLLTNLSASCRKSTSLSGWCHDLHWMDHYIFD